MAELYGVDPRTVNDHIEKIYRDGELTHEATIRKFRIVQKEGERFVNRNLLHYNLQMIREWLLLLAKCPSRVYIEKDFSIRSDEPILIDAKQNIPEYIHFT